MYDKELRKLEFRTELSVLEKDGKKTLIRTASCPEAVSFVKELPEKEEVAKAFIANMGQVVMGEIRNETIYYEDIHYPTLEELIAQTIRQRDRSFGASIIGEYIKFVHKLPSKKHQPLEFLKEFMIDTEEVRGPMDCMSVGLLDLIPCNILVGGRSWYIIDHEWTFGFPVPRDFVVYRGIVGLMEHLQKDIQQYVSRENPVALFWGYGENQTYIPWSWLELLTEMGIRKQVRQFHKWEYLFQKKVLVEASLGRLRLKGTPKPAYRIKHPCGLITSLIWIGKGIKEKGLRWQILR